MHPGMTCDHEAGTSSPQSAAARDSTGCEYPTVGEARETYRAVDLNGERAVIELGQSHESIDPALIEEARAIFDSIEFVGPDE